MPTKKPRKPRPDPRLKLVDAAMELFAYQGYGPTGLAQIAKKADVLPGSLWYYFPTKEDLLAATLERRQELLGPEVLDPVWAKVDDPIERVFALLAQYRAMLEVSSFEHGCPIGNLALEIGNTHPHSRELLAANFEGWLAAIEQCFRDAATRLPPSVEPGTLAVFVLTTMEGAVMLARTWRDFRAYDASVASLRDYVERLIDDATTWSVPRASKAATKSRARGTTPKTTRPRRRPTR
jgi:AcrR family transcriptional regulator